MKRTLRLFVYGTLQPGAGTDMARWLEARLVRAEPASVPGRLFAVNGGRGWFPALIPAKSGARVRGALCQLAFGPGDLTRLDRYEGREYRRICLPVRTDRGCRVGAQVYLWCTALPSKSPVIGQGDFPGWLCRTRRRAFPTPRHGA